MRPEAPTRSDRFVLAVVSGPVGHLVGTLLELAFVASQAASRWVRAFRASSRTRAACPGRRRP